jgi:hypothetical protein
MRAIITLTILASLSGGCAVVQQFEPVEARYERHKELCASLGLVDSEFANCVIELEKAHIGVATAASVSSNTGLSKQQREREMRTTYRQQRNDDMILRHGMGGCTPNFATGGCL